MATMVTTTEAYMNTNRTPLSAEQEEVLQKLLALRKLTRDLNVKTFRSQRVILQSLDSLDLAAVTREMYAREESLNNNNK